MEDVAKLKNIIYREENQVSESAVEVASLTTDDDCKTLSGVNDESDLEVTIRTACRGKHFRRTMSSLSDEKVAATYEIGFGSLHRFRCGKVNLPLCQMLVENFDVGNSCIKIHGRNLTITHEDFRRIMGVMDGGCDVNLEGSTEDPDILGLKSKLSRKEKEITIHGLRRLLIESESTDDTFKVSFALYALATLLIPVTGIEVDPRYLIPLKDPNALGSKNWAKFAFAKLVEGVSSFQATRTGLAGGCILFLQLFYLDVVGNGICIYPKIGKPVMTWSRDDLKRVYEKVESEGGFKSENVRVTKKYFRGNVLSGTGSVDPSTGIKTTVVDDLSEVRSDVGVVKGDIESLKLTVGRLEPDMGRLRRAILTLESTVGELKANGLGSIVAEAIKQVFEDKSYTYGGNFGNDDLFINEEHQGTKAEQHDDEMPHNKSIIVMSTDKDAYGCDSSDMEEDEAGSFPAVSEISQSDSYLLTYLFSKKVTADDSVGSNEVARHEEWSVSRWDMRSLSPMQCLTCEIVDISAAYLFDRVSDYWFMPTSFSERAKEYLAGVQVEGLVPSIVKLCRLGRFIGRFMSCKKIFFPVHDGVLKHWFLAVIKIPSWQCEIWDSNPEKSANKRREEYVAASISMIEKVFASEMQLSPGIHAKIGSLSIKYPRRSPRHPNSQDSGIFLIRSMQFYRQRWYQGFNSGDQRVRMALETVNHPKNEVLEQVFEAAAEEVPYDVVSAWLAQEYLNKNGSLPTAGMKFNPRRARR